MDNKWGRIRIEPGAPPVDSRRRAVVRYVWTPSEAIAGSLPAGFELSLECMQARDGTRRFVPTEVRGFILTAALAGNAILERNHNLDAAQRYSYRAMRTIYRWAARRREYLSRSFASFKDLVVAADCQLAGKA